MDFLVYYILIAIGGILLYFLFRWLFNKTNLSKSRCIVSTVISVFAVYFVAMLIFMTYIPYYPKHDFSKERWSKDIEKRYEISADLISSKLLIGKTTDEVIGILGDTKYKTKGDTTVIWEYYLGFVPGIASIDPDLLRITFINDKVTEVIQRTS